MVSTQTGLLTAEEYARLPDDGTPTELVRGKVVRMNPPYPFHGFVCSKIGRILGYFVEENDLGYVLSNDSGVITTRDPDTVRGADVAFYSYNRIPKGAFPQGAYLPVVPELVLEVRSPSDRWSEVLGKVTEYLRAGVTVVCVLDPASGTLQIYRDEELPQTPHGDDELTLPDVLGAAFRVPVRRFFE